MDSRKIIFTLVGVGILGFIGLNATVFVLRMDDPKGGLTVAVTIGENGVKPEEYQEFRQPEGRRVTLLVRSDRKLEVRSSSGFDRTVSPSSRPEGEAEINFKVQRDVSYTFFDSRTGDRLGSISIKAGRA